MLNETNSELEERSDSAAIEEMMIRTDVLMPALMDHMNHRQALKEAIEDQRRIEAMEWNRLIEREDGYEH